MSWFKFRNLSAIVNCVTKSNMPKTDTLDALDDDMKHTPNILWKYSEPTLNILWTYSEITLNIPWRYPDNTLMIPWRYAQDLTKSQKHEWLTDWLSNMDPRDASASKKVVSVLYGYWISSIIFHVCSWLLNGFLSF